VFPASNKLSDTNLRSHLGRFHKLEKFLYPSQRIRQPRKEPTISVQQKQKLDAAAVNAIVQDAHVFNVFRKSGMKGFLAEGVPGYRGPNRRTVVKRLKVKYKQRRSSIREELSTVSDIALSVDAWQSNRRDHFICLSAHYYDKNFKYQSNIITFRRFVGTHSADRINKFLVNETEKLGIRSKICSITTDNGPDVRTATRSGYGVKLSCFLHVLNLVIRNGLWLFEMPATQSSTASTNSSIARSATTTASTNSSIARSATTTASTNSSITRSATTTVSNLSNSAPELTSFVYSSIDDDEHDLLINVDKVSEELSDDSASSTSSDQDGTVTTSISSSEDESVLSSSESETENDLHSTTSQVMDEEDFFYRASHDITFLLKKVHILLKRVRKLVGFIHRSSVLHRYVAKQMKLEIDNYNQNIASNDPSMKNMKFKELTLDMKVRWSSTYAMLSRFIFYKSVICSLTYDLTKRMNLTPRQNQKLKKLTFTSFEWRILETLQTILLPFYNSTMALSTRKRPTLSCNKTIMIALANFFTVDENEPTTLEILLKQHLSTIYQFYMEKHITDEQLRATLVASFLDPMTYHYLTCADKKEAEAIICTIATGHLAKINSQPLSSTNPLSISIRTASTVKDPNDRLNPIENLLISCGIPVRKLSSTNTNLPKKPSAIKEELAQYVANHGTYGDFTEYWEKNQSRLPILASIVRKYNIMCATSIECESAFSIAGYIQRKNRSSLAPATLRYSMILREKSQN
ncbi:unnamed protein product, partial [Adineta ricciae]